MGLYRVAKDHQSTLSFLNRPPLSLFQPVAHHFFSPLKPTSHLTLIPLSHRHVGPASQPHTPTSFSFSPVSLPYRDARGGHRDSDRCAPAPISPAPLDERHVPLGAEAEDLCRPHSCRQSLGHRPIRSGPQPTSLLRHPWEIYPQFQFATSTIIRGEEGGVEGEGEGGDLGRRPGAELLWQPAQ